MKNIDENGRFCGYEGMNGTLAFYIYVVILYHEGTEMR